MPAPLSLDIRERIVYLVECGLSHDGVAEDLGISQPTVSRLIHHYKKHGHFYPIKPTGNTPTFNESDYSIVREIVKEHSDATLAQYAELIAKKTNKPVMSPPTICRLLQKLNLRRKKKSKYAEERDRKDVKKKT